MCSQHFWATCMASSRWWLQVCPSWTSSDMGSSYSCLNGPGCHKWDEVCLQMESLKSPTRMSYLWEPVKACCLCCFGSMQAIIVEDTEWGSSSERCQPKESHLLIRAPILGFRPQPTVYPLSWLSHRAACHGMATRDRSMLRALTAPSQLHCVSPVCQRSQTCKPGLLNHLGTLCLDTCVVLSHMSK